MAIEIERKFLVCNDSWKPHVATYYCQGYLNRNHQRTVRVRIAGEQAFLTIKGPTQNASRSEFEYSLPMQDAREMLHLCEQPLIEKNRRLIQHLGFTWEVDEFMGRNAGLVVAEIELPSIDTKFEKPDWVGDEVTEDPRYYNSNLSAYPFSDWNHA